MLMGALIGAALGAAVYLITKQMKPKNDDSTIDKDVKQESSEK